jgi:hypothetical protein
VLHLDATLLGRLADKRLFIKITSHSGDVFFITYINSVRSEIDGSNLICAL